jgi:hypothetical protein
MNLRSPQLFAVRPLIEAAQQIAVAHCFCGSKPYRLSASVAVAQLYLFA